MRTILLFFVTVFLLTACTNSQTDSTNDGRDTVNRRDTLPDNTDNNTVTPPASNGQF